jgi:hypothetical protein
LIDRLVDGELPDAERRALLLRLEHEPDGWRRCALAFLEAQSWREAFAPLAAAPRPVSVGAVPARKPRAWRSVARWTGLAASLATAYALGWAWHPGPVGPKPGAPLAKGEMTAPPAPAEPRPQDTPPSKQPAPTTLASPVLARLEQRGFQAETQRRVVSMELQDGRKLDVPVREVRLRYVGGRTY